MSGKGSSPRPYSVDQKTFDDNWDKAFKRKENIMDETKPPVPCGCGRSPTGYCMGWHRLTEEDFRMQLAEYEDKQNKENQP
jgi:hypothetical protein